jgi:hypothetical protein
MIRHSDERVKKVNEVLQGIRVIKYNSWEKPVRVELAAGSAFQI